MPHIGRVVVLNGPPRSGKSSTAKAIQARGPGVWMELGVDRFKAATPENFQPGVGLRPGGERPDLEPLVVDLYAALYDSIAAHARRGFNVVADTTHHDWYSKPLGIVRSVAPLLAELGAYFIGVRCPIDVVMARRDATGWTRDPPLIDGVPDAVMRWHDAVHVPGIYDLEIDTSTLTPDEAADAVLKRLAGAPPVAFATIATGG